MTQQPKGLDEGIYFNLGNDEYHRDPALSHSGMTDLLISWQDYWDNSCLNPDRKEWKQTDAMAFGERSAMLLMQPSLFKQRFNMHGGAPKAGGQWLSSVEFNRIKESVDGILSVKIAKDHFTQGYAEVAIFWRDPETGVMLRAKIDYLRTFGCIDFKRIRAISNRAIGQAVRDQGLDIQNFLYLQAVKAGRNYLKRIGEAGLDALAERENVDPKWLRGFRDETELLFRFLFQRSTPPYIWEFRELEQEVLVEGANATFAAIKRYCEGLERFGTKKPPLGYNTLKTISNYHVPRREYDYEQ